MMNNPASCAFQVARNRVVRIHAVSHESWRIIRCNMINHGYFVDKCASFNGGYILPFAFFFSRFPTVHVLTDPDLIHSTTRSNNNNVRSHHTMPTILGALIDHTSWCIGLLKPKPLLKSILSWYAEVLIHHKRWKVFTSWDYGIANVETSHNKVFWCKLMFSFYFDQFQFYIFQYELARSCNQIFLQVELV